MDLQTFVITFAEFLNNVIIPFLIGIAFLIFVVNVIRYFVIGGGEPESREKARMLATYALLGFTFILILWGIVNMLTSSLGLTNGGFFPCPDYFNEFDNTLPTMTLSDCTAPGTST